jgi:hypothetical protein
LDDYYFNEDGSVDDEIECLHFAGAHRELYGSLALFTYKNLFKNKLITFSILGNKDRVFKKIYEMYIKNLQIETNDPSCMFKKTKQFIKSMPSLKSISKYMEKKSISQERHKKNIFFMKLCLDIYENYYKTFDCPLFDKYKNKFISTALKFYLKLTDDQHKYIKDQITTTIIRRLSKHNNNSIT